MKLKTMYKANYISCFHFKHSFVILLGLGLFFFNTVSGEGDNFRCQLKPPVSNATESVQLDLLSFLRQNNLFGERFSLEEKSSHIVYDFMICGDVTSERENAALIRKDKYLDHVAVIGLRNDISISGVKGEWFLLTHGPGDHDSLPSACKNISLTSSVMLICDWDYSHGEFKLVYKDEQYCTYLFELRMATVCGDAPRMSSWLVLFIICLVAFLCYFIFGVLYLRFRKGAKEIDQIPHRHFWFAVGNKLADGCSAVCRCDQYCSDPINRMESHSPYSRGYSPIGEHTPATISAHNTERDAPLLNP